MSTAGGSVGRRRTECGRGQARRLAKEQFPFVDKWDDRDRNGLLRRDGNRDDEERQSIDHVVAAIGGCRYPLQMVVVVFSAEHQMGQHFCQFACRIRMMGMVVLLVGKNVMAAITMAGYFAFVNQPLPFTIVVVVRHKGMQQNDCTSQRYQYFCKQLLHNEWIASISDYPRNNSLICNDTKN